MIDFGLSKRYKDPRTGRHIPYKDGKDLTGTARYASLNTHLGIEQARRDDLEQIGFVLLYFIRGSLPWQGMAARTKEEKYQQIKVKKATTTIEDLTHHLPLVLRNLLNYARKLQFEERPDYSKLIRSFNDEFVKHNFEMYSQYEWVLRRAALKQRMAQVNAFNEN